MTKEKMYVDADEVARDWGVSKSQAYKIIQKLNLQTDPGAVPQCDHREWQGEQGIL